MDEVSREAGAPGPRLPLVDGGVCGFFGPIFRRRNASRIDCLGNGIERSLLLGSSQFGCGSSPAVWRKRM